MNPPKTTSETGHQRLFWPGETQVGSGQVRSGHRLG